MINNLVQSASLRWGAFWAVRDLFISPQASLRRRRGRLLGHVVGRARAAGALRVSLRTKTKTGNGPAHACYAPRGFRTV